MSNANENPSFNAGFIPGQIIDNGNGLTIRHELFELPNGKEAMVGIRTGEMRPEADRAAEREAYLLTIFPPNLTEGLEREIARLTERFDEVTGYDLERNPIMRVQGRERSLLEMKLANRRRALTLAQMERAEAERVQARAAHAKSVQEQIIQARAETRAQEIIEEAEIERRAKQIAKHKAGVG